MWFKVFIVVPLLVLQETMGQDNTTSAGDPGGGTSDVVPKAVITVAVISVAFIIGVIVAKLVDMVYDRQAIRDDASDISEYTKDLLKLQFMVAFNKKNKFVKETPEDIARRMTKLWRIGVAKKKAQRKLDAKRASLRAKQNALHPNTKTDHKTEDKKVTGPRLVKSIETPPAKLSTINEKEQPRNSVNTKKPPQTKDVEQKEEIKPELTAKLSHQPTDDSKTKTEVDTVNLKTEGKATDSATHLEREQFDSKKTETVKSGVKPTDNLANGVQPGETNLTSALPSLTTTVPSPHNSPHKSYVEFRADSDDLMIPVSTDEGPNPMLKVSSGRRESGTSSKSDYEFLKDPDDSARTARTSQDYDNPAKTPSSVSGVRLESNSREAQKVKNKPTTDTVKSRPVTASSRAGPISGRHKSSAPPLITPTGRRPVSGKIVTPQGVKVVSRPKTPANTSKH